MCFTKSSMWSLIKYYHTGMSPEKQRMFMYLSNFINQTSHMTLESIFTILLSLAESYSNLLR